MNRTFLVVIAAFLAIAGTMLVRAMSVGTSPVMLPSELAAQDEGAVLQRVRVGGRVTGDPVVYETEPRFRLAFRIEDPTHSERGSVPVVFYGIRPDMFAPGRDVIVDGEFREGELRASNLLTQCPSKYEPPDPEKMYGESREGAQP